MSVRPVTETLARLEGGLFIDRISDKLAELVRMVDETGKAGKITITMGLKKSAGAIAITSDVVAKMPEAKADATLLWPTVEGNLALNNPAQRSLDLQAVPERPKAVQTVNADSGEILQAPPRPAVQAQA